MIRTVVGLLAFVASTEALQLNARPTTRRNAIAAAAAGTVFGVASAPAWAAPLFEPGTGRPGDGITSLVTDVTAKPAGLIKDLNAASEAAAEEGKQAAIDRARRQEDAKEARAERLAEAKAARQAAGAK